MKKLWLISFFLVFIGFFAFGQTEGQEEIDYLLFMPNSGSRFVNEAQAMVQLDNLARYLLGRNLIPGQIYVYGYAAFAVNDIDPVDLSRERALSVINELQRRGVPRDLFSVPVAYGSVNIWGANTSEADRIPNRRVRIMLEGYILTPETLKAAEPEVIISSVEPEIIISSIEDKEDDKEPVVYVEKTEKPRSSFPWWILLLLLLLALIAALIYLLSRRKKSSTVKTAEPAKAETASVEPVKAEPERTEPVKAEPEKPEPAAEPVKAAPVAPAVAAVVTTKKVVNLEEEIRLRAYELYQERNGQNGDAAGDWYRAVIDVSARYEPAGYQVYTEDGTWWASLQETKPAE